MWRTSRISCRETIPSFPGYGFAHWETSARPPWIHLSAPITIRNVARQGISHVWLFSRRVGKSTQTECLNVPLNRISRRDWGLMRVIGVLHGTEIGLGTREFHDLEHLSISERRSDCGSIACSCQCC